MWVTIVLLALLVVAAMAGVTGRGAVDTRDPDVSLFRAPGDQPRKYG